MTSDESHGPNALEALVQVPATHYGKEYDSLERFQSYWHQLHEAAELGGSILEIGIGNGTVSSILRSRGLEVVTADIDGKLGPDVVADVRELPFADRSFDGTLACEILEHIPWGDLPRALGELRRVTRRWALLSVPSVGPAATLQASLPNALHIVRMMVRRRWGIRDGLWALSQSAVWKRAGGTVSCVGAVEPVRRRTHAFDGQHEWVLGEDGRTAEHLRALATASGFASVREFRPEGAVSHHFFVLQQ